MLTGFVCGLTVLFLIINLFTRDAINPDLLNTNDQNRAEVATRVQRQDFNTFVEQANIGQLVATLKSLQQVDRRRNVRTDAVKRTPSTINSGEYQQHIFSVLDRSKKSIGAGRPRNPIARDYCKAREFLRS